MNVCVSVQDGALHYTVLAHYVYHDQESTQHLLFVQYDYESNRHLTNTEQGTTAAFPGVTGDGAVRTDLEDVDLDIVVTAQQTRSIGISPATAAKLSSFLQWTLGKHTVAKARGRPGRRARHGAP
jgi:hypothetical protein